MENKHVSSFLGVVVMWYTTNTMIIGSVWTWDLIWYSACPKMTLFIGKIWTKIKQWKTSGLTLFSDKPKLLRIKTYMYSTMHIYDPTLITEAFLQVPPSVLHSTSFLGGNLQVGGGQTCSSPPAITTPNTWEQTEHGKPKACSCKKKSMLSWAGCWMSLFNPIYTLYLSVYIYIYTHPNRCSARIGTFDGYPYDLTLPLNSKWLWYRWPI